MKKKLDEWKKQYDALEVRDHELDQAIEAGMQKAVKQQFWKRWGITPVVTVAIILLSFITIINASPTFAAQVAKYPGMDKLIEFVQFDKGQKAAIENDYFQVIDKSVTQGDLTLTVDGVIRDENGLVLFYTVSSEKELDRVRLEESLITNVNGRELAYQSKDYSPQDENRGTVEYYTDDPIRFDDFTFTTEVVGVETLDNGVGNQLRETISIDFHAENTKESIQYQVDETVKIEGQKIHIDSVTIQPLRTTVNLYADPENDMRILAIDDIALVDEKGEEWTGIQNGMTASGTIEDENYEVYLQSNYFEQPESLALTFSKVQAVNRDEDYFRFDLEKEQILHDPYDKFYDLTYESGWLSISMDKMENYYMDPFGEILDLDGNVMEQIRSSSSHQSNQKTTTFKKAIQTDERIIDIKLSGYPNWIEQKVAIPLN
ncbi:DUF4179 domain-containing protein [Gracilibacillus thailandensis]|uniref:DUF4179 domain-containing protein n=1 Tax=Gracilibacillus thailandensis TaxID=563735 RepID=A0A6N7R4A4_9BACI|nr:DUF4179 domain-containing protein [Gracilibacillus thailandensis]MRI68052.1 DUF4179 domain-containing protein [Gracilibacillus thailandensis]